MATGIKFNLELMWDNKLLILADTFKADIVHTKCTVMLVQETDCLATISACVATIGFYILDFYILSIFVFISHL